MKNLNSKDTGHYRNEFSDIWSERMLVTSLVHHPEFISIVQKLIPYDEVFQDEAARMVYSAIRELYNERAEIKNLSVFQRLRSKDQFSIIRREKISLSNDEMVPQTEREVFDTAEGVLSLFRRSRASDLNIELNSELKKENKDSEVAELVYKTYEALTLTGGGILEKTAKDSGKNALARIDQNMKLQQTGKISGVTTGSKKLDSILGGWQDDQMIIIAGRPAMGKTAVGIDFTLAAAESGAGVGFFSVEMPSEQITFRMAARKSGVPYQRIRKGEIDIEEYKRIETAISEIGKLPIYFYDDMSVKDVRKLEAIATEWKRKKDIKLIIIDYIQYLDIKGYKSSYDRVTEISKAIKTMQRNLKIPVIALAQLSRGTEGRTDPRPKESDLRDSGQLEQDASLVIGLFNPLYYIRKGIKIYDELEDGEVLFDEKMYCYYILKNRDGEACRVDRYADLGTNHFSDYRGSGQPVVMPEPVNAAVKNAQQIHNYSRNEVFNHLGEPPF
ncbi:DnaB-like helicase C-terminal domain-containing protein [Dyadobacter sp. LHD-138]|uniref:replicative DNA helicase n=1 Tax=Dyadobacter sp. LHD-138 TaxID=3071413 RepID=UPI0027E09758|nr:DnaB-like helicase C-terminal domain-containing protein [Dyadobacter sp. LHD-138]MDQ6477823.1 DnaB-like helicase C-terminal domain-containing protein [Dyadobacter sp. LHD-138]